MLLQLAGWVHVVATREGSTMALYSSKKKIADKTGITRAKASFANGGYEDHTCSIGHFQRNGYWPGGGGTDAFMDNAPLADLRLYDYALDNDPSSSLASALVTVCSDGWTASAYQTCYRFFDVPKTWQRAEDDSATRGGHLAIVNSDEGKRIVVGITGGAWPLLGRLCSGVSCSDVSQ